MTMQSPLFTLQDGFVYQAESGEPKGLMKYPENKTKQEKKKI